MKIFGLAEKDVDEREDREESTHETVDNVLALFKEKLGLAIGKEEIDIAHRLGKKKADKKPRTIQVRFVRRLTRMAVIDARKNLKNTGIVIVEDLCPILMDMFNDLKTRFGKKQVWTFRGDIFCKFADRTRKVTIQNYHDVMDEAEELARGTVGGATGAEGIEEIRGQQVNTTPIFPPKPLLQFPAPLHTSTPTPALTNTTMAWGLPALRGFGRGQPRGRGRARSINGGHGGHNGDGGDGRGRGRAGRM